MLRYLITDLIITQIKCGECLCEIVNESSNATNEPYYFVALLRVSQILYASANHSIADEVKSGECLYEEIMLDKMRE